MAGNPQKKLLLQVLGPASPGTRTLNNPFYKIQNKPNQKTPLYAKKQPL
jgi:hypothetical protein